MEQAAKRLILDYIGAYDAGDKRHALEIMQELGVKWSTATPHPIADCWVFDGCVDVPVNLPSFIKDAA
jgi:hypothetical protein